jgi:hypothetical protein
LRSFSTEENAKARARFYQSEGFAPRAEGLAISEVLEMSKTFPVPGHLEALENSSVRCNGPMKSCAKNLAEVAWQR